MPTGINWTDETWNPIVGCSKISPGCANCYAAEAAKSARLQQFPQYQKTKEWNGAIAFVESQLEKPYQWKKPKKIFVCSMSDLFHENVTDEMLLAVFGVIRDNPHHTFQLLTKRPEKALQKFWELDFTGLPNVWMGVTVENQAMANERIPFLYKIPAAKRWLSIEPLLEPVDLCNGMVSKGTKIYEKGIPNGIVRQDLDGINWLKYMNPWFLSHVLKLTPEEASKPDIDWVVVGGESGKNARPCHLDWITSVVQQCQQNNVPVFVKQLGANVNESGNRIPNPKGDRAWSKLENLPKYLQIREFPHD